MTIVFVHPATLNAAGNVAIVLDMQGAARCGRRSCGSASVSSNT